ncbi:histone deacetylase family protein [Dictyocaulus viviparus]|uniref:Histone deacetylase family protein n=1 Tax=Dictyocaulus viviparus TaxID=29172 RepID=A0A0D8XS31_DICVI|nr:histone deacetylase family protein [Dictyocaulus viviparus]
MFFISDKAMLMHYCPWDTYHIEVPNRLETVLCTVQKTEILKRVHSLSPRMASEEEIEMVHTKRYINEIKRTTQMYEDELEKFSSQYEDIYVNRQTFHAALLAAGCAIELVDAALRTGKPGFAAVRPPGHHAFPDQGCGFCIFNNVVIAAKHALKKGNSRVLIVDWDVHAGQGTQECIKDDERICLISIHRFQRGYFWPCLRQSAVKTQCQLVEVLFFSKLLDTHTYEINSSVKKSKNGTITMTFLTDNRKFPLFVVDRNILWTAIENLFVIDFHTIRNSTMT